MGSTFRMIKHLTSVILKYVNKHLQLERILLHLLKTADAQNVHLRPGFVKNKPVAPCSGVFSNLNSLTSHQRDFGSLS